jgi:hypothetical protein
MYIMIVKGKPTDWYSTHIGARYKVMQEGYVTYLIEQGENSGRFRTVLKDDCEEVKDELFCDGIKAHMLAQRPKTTDEAFRHDAHYDNKNGSLYKFAEDHKLNCWEFDVIKRIVRCRKKGQFKEDLEKTKRVIDLYLREHDRGNN